MAQGRTPLGTDVGAYGPLCALFHDTDKPRAPDAEVAWYTARLPRDAGLVLEAMAGSGRLFIPLTEAGFAVHGVDASESMLASCAARLKIAGHEPQLFRQNVATLNLPFRYAAACVAAGSFQRLADSIAAIEALARIRAHLVDPGILLLDLFVPGEAEHPPGAPVVEVRTIALPDGSQIARRSETFFDTVARRIDVQSRYERRQRARVIAREDEAHALTWHTEDEVTAMLRDAGYRDIAIEPPASAPEGERARHFAVSARI
jgi:ubiquinone/menaquinone biosynthesis C-methylase UbiE